MKYYVRKSLENAKPEAIYRCFDDPARAPEVINPRTKQWKESKNFWAQMGSGELAESDRVEESEANRIIAAW